MSRPLTQQSLKFYIYLSHYLGKKAFESVLSPQGPKMSIVPKGKSPLILLCIHVPSWKASTTFTCQSICNLLTLTHSGKSSRQRTGGLALLTLLALEALWLPCLRSPGLWPHTHLPPRPLPLPLPPLPYFTLDLCLSASNPHLNQACSLPKE